MADNFPTISIRSKAPAAVGRLPLTAEMLIESPSGDIFGMTQNAGMGLNPRDMLGRNFLIMSTLGGTRASNGKPFALGLHTGHFDLDFLIKSAAAAFQENACVPFSVFVSDPCDGRTQGTKGMMDSLAYRNTASEAFGRLARSLPTRKGVLGIATCDKGLPAMMMALAGMHDAPTIVVPGGVTLPASNGLEDTGKVQSLGARFANNDIALSHASEAGCMACGTSGGGCQFLGTAATSQVVAEALGLALPHSALVPSDVDPMSLIALSALEPKIKYNKAQLLVLMHSYVERSPDERMRGEYLKLAADFDAAEAAGKTKFSLRDVTSRCAILDVSARSADALAELETKRIYTRTIITDESIHNAMVVHAAFGGSSNLLLHIAAIAYEAGLKVPTREDWEQVNRTTPRLVEVLPNNPKYVTVQAYLAGGVPEVMLHLRELGLLNLNCMTVTGQTLDENLNQWQQSARRSSLRQSLIEQDGVDPSEVISSPQQAQQKGLTGTLTFPNGNIAPEGSVIKSTSINPQVVDADGVYRFTGPARIFTSEAAAIAAIKLKEGDPNKVKPGDVIVLAGSGPIGTGMEETYQLTSALKYVNWGQHVALITDGRFSGVSTGACIGHIGPEALAGGPIGKLQNGDMIQIEVDRNNLTGNLNFIGTDENIVNPDAGARILAERQMNPDIKPHPSLPEHSQLWAALQSVSGGTWAGCVYNVQQILRSLSLGEAVEKALPGCSPQQAADMLALAQEIIRRAPTDPENAQAMLEFAHGVLNLIAAKGINTEEARRLG